MKAIASILGGVCVFEDDPQRRFVSLKDLSFVDQERAHLSFGALDDWAEFVGTSQDELLKDLEHRHRIARAVSNIELCLLGISNDLQKDLLVDVEEMLKEDASQNDIAACLLRAPLENVAALSDLVTECLAQGLASSAALLEEVRESQPLLRRFADRWLGLPDTYFEEFSGGRQRIWRMGVDAGIIRQSLKERDASSIEQSWAQLAFSLKSATDRVKVAAVAKAVADAMYPTNRAARTAIYVEKPEYDGLNDAPSRLEGYESYRRVMKQVGAIVSAVSEGHDTKARRFMHQLLHEQTSVNMGEANAIRSLCNIASRCADMFRTDFEYECLELARNTDPHDARTQIQLADHFKRVGRFDDAIATLRNAMTLGDFRFVQAGLADVYVQMQEYEKAIEAYNQIPNGELDEVIRGAKADVLRLSGNFDLAKAEYDRIIFEGHSSNRVQAGLAEIAKRTGDLSTARRLYEGNLVRETDEKSLTIYRLALANVLVRAGDLKEAYQHVDAVVTACPFNLQAKAFRAAVEGLLGNPIKALLDVPQLPGVNAFNAWVTGYVRGLLLLLLNRYEDGKAALLRNVEASFRDGTGEGMLRLGAAVCFLRTSAGVETAAEILDKSPEMADAFADSIRAALKYHVAIAQQRIEDITRLKEILSSVEDTDLRALVSALEAKDWKGAWNLEVRALLRLQLAA